MYHRHDPGPDRLGERRPRRDHAGKIGVGGCVRRFLRRLCGGVSFPVGFCGVSIPMHSRSEQKRPGARGRGLPGVFFFSE